MGPRAGRESGADALHVGSPSCCRRLLEVFCPKRSNDGKMQITVKPTWTDNGGNGAALNKLMTTRYLASAVLMEIGVHAEASCDGSGGGMDLPKTAKPWEVTGQWRRKSTRPCHAYSCCSGEHSLGDTSTQSAGNGED